MTHDHSQPHHENTHSHEHAPAPRRLPGHAVQALHDSQAEKRASRRVMFAGQHVDAVLEMNEDAWRARSAATDVVVAATEELLARLVADHFPTAVAIVLYEDTSHDAPHGHLEKIVDADGHTLILGTSDQWHDLAWAQEADEYVWDLHHLDRDGFVYEEHNRRRRHIPINPQA